MSANRHGGQSEGSKPRDHEHPHHHTTWRPHHDWRVWLAVLLMLALVGVYVMTMDLSWRPGSGPTQPMPANNAP